MTTQKIHVDFGDAAGNESRVRLTGAIGKHDIWVKSDAEMAADMTPWLPLLLPIAMSAGYPLALHGPIDPVSLAHAASAQSVLSEWFSASRPKRGPKRLDYRGQLVRTLERVPIEVDEVNSPRRSAAGVVVLFSGGADAFYAALHSDFSHLLFVHGADIPLSAEELLGQIGRRLRAAADDMGRPLIQASTNVRDLSDQWVDWGSQYHGAALAGVALAHASLWGRAIVASGSMYEPSKGSTPWGSHPRLDALWSSSCVAVENDAGAIRAEKLSQIASWPVAMRHLRVCNTKRAYNCGKCEKCVRTMLALHVNGALTRCETLPTDLNPEMVRSVWITGSSKRGFARENLAALIRSREWELSGALLRAISKGYFIEAHRSLPDTTKRALRKVRRPLSPKG